MLGLLWQQRQHLSLALLMLVLCTASNLAAPVLSGLLTEALINNQPLEKYAQVRRVPPSLPSSQSEPLTS